MKQLSVKVPDELVARLEAECRRVDRSVAWLVRQAVMAYLEGDAR